MESMHIHIPSKPKVIKEDITAGTYQIDGLYPGYGHTLGNSLRRIIWSSIPGTAIVGVKIEGIQHEFSTIEGVQEDVIAIILNLKQIQFRSLTNEPQVLTLSVKGPHKVVASDITIPGQIELLTPDVHIATITGKTSLTMELHLATGLGYVPKELLYKDRVTVGMIPLDATFTPVRRVNYEVENMRVGDRTDFNRLSLHIETNGSIEPRTVLEKSIYTMIEQLKAIVGFEEKKEYQDVSSNTDESSESVNYGDHNGTEEDIQEFLKTRIESLALSTRTENALSNANIRTVGGLVRKKENDLLDLEGLGEKGIQEIKRALGNYGITLK